MSRLIQTIKASCNTCGGTAGTEVARVRDLEFGTCSNEFMFVRCTGCGLVYLRNRPTDEELSTIYPPEYYQYEAFLGSFGRAARRWSQRQKGRFMRRYAGPGARILDVGCGTGELLRLLKDGGDQSWQLAGVDVSAEAVSRLRDAGIEAVQGRFEDLRLPPASFDIVLMNQTIEHLGDPRGCLRAASEVLRPGGVLILETPSLDAWDARWFPSDLWAGWHCPRHWNLYTPETLRALASACGFQVVKISPLPSPYFWLRSLQHVVGHRWHWRRLASHITERSIPLLGGAVLLDAVQVAVRGRTSNIRLVGRKPVTMPAGTKLD